MRSGLKVLSLKDIAEQLDATLRGDAKHCVSRLADLEKATSSDIAFLSSSKYLSALATTQAGAVIMRESDAEGFSGNVLIVDDPYVAYAILSAQFETRQSGKAGIHPSAVIHADAILGESIAIGPHCVVGEGAVIGNHCELAPGVIIGDFVQIGEYCLLHANVAIYHHVRIGHHVIIHSNTTIGSDGFGFAPSKQGWQKIHQLGSVTIGNHVEIGANTAIDRGALQDTVVEDNVIIDNQVHVAHNVKIGAGTAIAGCTGIAGSTRFGKNCIIAGACSISGHLDIADNTHFNGATVVTRGNKNAGTFASAAPIQDVKSWRKNSVRFKQLDELFTRVKNLERAQHNKNET